MKESAGTLATAEPVNFIRHAIDEDLRAGAVSGPVVTRFPPEPNGHLHIGHAKSICLNFGIARDYPGAHCYLRFDDTNPTRERADFIAAIQEDVRWLGFDWGERLRHASDYFEQLYAWALALITQGDAYVCSLSPEEIRSHRGTLTEPGRDSPYRNRPVDESVELLGRMRAGDFPEGSHVLRARIDMSSPNLNLRDPVIYRIVHAAHPVTGDAWRVYPMYDYAQAMSDAIEGVTHSLCTLEFEDHRPLYDWFLARLRIPSPPRQIEFSRLNLTYTVMSKRMLTRLVDENHVDGWDDPRMPTLCGLRRRGVPPESIRELCDRVGVTKKDNVVEVEFFEGCVRAALDPVVPRAMGVLRPLRVVIENYPEGQVETFEGPNHPQDPALGTRTVEFSRELFVEQDDFQESPPRKFFRLAPGREVRLRYAYLVTCTDVVKNDAGEVVEVRCTYDPETRGGNAPDGRKVKGTIHWVSAHDARRARVRLYDRLFVEENPGRDGADMLDQLNPDSLEVIEDAWIEPALAERPPGHRVQLERLGYFCVDPTSGTDGVPVLNRTATLRDTWRKVARG